MYVINDYNLFNLFNLDAIAQSVQLIALGWNVRGLSSFGGQLLPHPSRPVLGPTQSPTQSVTVHSLRGGSGRGAAGSGRGRPEAAGGGRGRPGAAEGDVDHSPHLVLRLKKEYS